jgi:hypothetical protein
MCVEVNSVTSIQVHKINFQKGGGTRLKVCLGCHIPLHQPCHLSTHDWIRIRKQCKRRAPFKATQIKKQVAFKD